MERLIEILIARAHTRRLLARSGIIHHGDGIRALVLVNVVFLIAWPLETLFAPWAQTGPWTWPLLGFFLLAQALRYWCIHTLGDRWTLVVVTVPGAPLIRTGPYRIVRHPNYVAVVIELLALPLAFTAWATALLVGTANGLALRHRIRIENRVLGPAPSRESR